MSKIGPIILIEDDSDDAAVFQEALIELSTPNKVVWFVDPTKALDYLKTSNDSPFIIFSDINMPKCTGIELKKMIDEDRELRKKSIPFVFYTTSVSHKTIDDAYTVMTVQGYFQKGHSYGEIKAMLSQILGYWTLCRHPNST